MQVYLWWSNAGAMPEAARGTAIAALTSASEREADAAMRHVAGLAIANVRASG
jgi:hypothetical protein